MTPMQPNSPITITLAAQQWDTVLGALNEAPHRVARPVFDSIIAQIQSQQPQADASPIAAKPNGADEHAPH